MSHSVLANEKEMKTLNLDEDLIDVDHYRKLVRTFIDLRRYETALFWAEKVVQFSNDDAKDVYWLAQCMFLLKEYHRAAHIIKSKGLEKTHLMCHYLVIESLLEAKEYQEALEILNTVDAEDLANTAMHSKEEESFGEQYGFEKTTKNEMLASIYYIKGKVYESMDNRTMATDFYVQALHKSVYCAEALDALVQHEMLMAWEECELLQHLPVKQQCSPGNAKIIQTLYENKLKKYYNSVYPQRNAEQTPIGNFGALQSMRQFSDKLNQEKKVPKSTKPAENFNLSSRLFTPTMQIIMSPANKILNDLRNTPSYSIHTSLTKLNEMNKTKNTPFKLVKQDSETSISFKLSNERLQNSIDILAAKAEKYFYNCEYNKCLKIVDDILKRDPYHSRCLTVQIGCLVEMKEFNKLFYVAHKLVDLYPDQAISWYAVGCYYDIIGKSDPARRFLMKATSLDRLFGPAWLAYGHSFARENEHDQAMAAYFKATQLMRGCHLPLLYIGVECGLTKNVELAEKFFYQAMAIAPLDVFVLHELGVIKFEYEYYESAEEVFRMTLEMVKHLAMQNTEPISARWEPLLNNLGHCCRKNRKYDEALYFHQRALILKPQSASTYKAIGFVQALMGKLEDAVDSLHKSLSLKRDDIFATTLQKYVIEDLMEEDSLLMEQSIDQPPQASTAAASSASNLDETKIGELDTTDKRKLNCVKLNFDDYDSNTSQNSELCDTNNDMSMDM